MKLSKRRGAIPILSKARAMLRWKHSLLLLLVILFGALPEEHAWSADVLVGKEVPVAKRIAMKRLSHAAWDKLLSKYVDQGGMVAYKRWNASREDKRLLERYLESLSTVKLGDGERRTQLAYWINAYNAVTVWGILREYPTSSIRNHTAKLWGYNIWKNLKLRVDGRKLSLDDIEHKILRKAGEPRIHFGIVCASISCPRLLSEAYTAEKLYEQLDSNAKHFFGDKERFSWDTAGKVIRLSPILNWFEEDFGKSQSDRLKFVAKFAPAAAKPLLNSQGVRVKYLGYDWGLNDQR